MLANTKQIHKILLSIYKNNPELGHLQMLKTLNWIDGNSHQPWGKWLEKEIQQTFTLNDKRLSQKLWQLNFNNPLGLAPGCDKDGIATGMWHNFGFGFAELGAVTLHPQEGNPKPRLFRLPLDKAVLNRMGANNLGAKVMQNTLKAAWERKSRQIPIGINLCKSAKTPLEEAASDYLGSFRLLKDWADYFVVNVSSPNTKNLRNLQAANELQGIIASLMKENQGEKPIFVKIAPDLEWYDIAAIVNLGKTYKLAGIIATNTSTRRDNLKTKILPATGKPIEEEAGGISGIPIKTRATEVIRFIWKETKGEIPIIGVGGIFTAEDAWEKITAGASLIQVYTGWIYLGPWMVPEILQGLLGKLDSHGLSHISEAVGMDN